MPLFECPRGFIGASEACVPLFECPMGFVGASEACVPLFECPMGFVGASEACESSQRLERSACDRTGLVSAAGPGWGVPRAGLGQGQRRLVRGGGTANLIQQTLVLIADDRK